MKTYRELISNEEFFAAALMQIPIFVIDAIDESEVDEGGTVQKYTDFSVWIKGVSYPRHKHVFKVSS